MDTLDREHCYAALCARDRRFDGVFFVGVETTGIYCRPVCSARTPQKARCRFFKLAAEAERAGFRACFRCRPERAPGDAAVDRGPELVRRALARINRGALDHASVDVLAKDLGVTGRHLRRTLEAHLGVTPIELAQSRRLGLAKWLLQDSRLPMTEVALASGFSSIRRFNAAFAERFSCSPTELRRKEPDASESGLVLRLEARPPFAGRELFAFLRDRAIPGVEHVTETTYERVVCVSPGSEHARALRRTRRVRQGTVRVELDEGRTGVIARIDHALLPDLTDILVRLRSLFDLDARPDRIAAHLAQSTRIAPLLARTPGMRVAGAFDPWEVAVRAMLGQQVSVRAATTLAGRLVERFGQQLEIPSEAHVSWRFPTAAELSLANADSIRSIGIPTARARALIALAEAVHRGTLDLSNGATADEMARSLVGIPGIGEWTASYIALRVLRDPDVFVGGDLVAKRALGVKTTREAERAAEVFRPFRAYALMYLWNSEATR